MAGSDATPPMPEQALAREAQQRPRVAIAAMTSASLTLLGGIITGLVLPNPVDYDDRIVTVVEALRRTADGQAVPDGRLSAYAQAVGDDALPAILGTVLTGIGALLLFLPLAYLFRATRARRPGLGQIALIVAAVGAVGLGLGRTVAQAAQYAGAAGFGGDGAATTNAAARDALSPAISVPAQVVWQLGALALALAFVLICLNAMRVGLLSRFMGILGVIVGGTFILPIDQQGIIRIFWLIALSFLILGRWPGGMPRAWASGQAEPWPTQQQVREAARRERGADGADEEEEDGPRRLPAPGAPSPRRPTPRAESSNGATARRRRKRRS